MAKKRQPVAATSTSSSAGRSGSIGDAEYSSFLHRVQSRFRNNLILGDNVLFRTAPITSLFNTYLNGFMSHVRQHYNCHCCHEFIKRYGNLVIVNSQGDTVPAMWHVDDAWSTEQEQAIRGLQTVVSKSRISSVFYSDQDIWGSPEAGGWHHLAVIPPRELLQFSLVQTPLQTMAESKEQFKNLQNAIADYRREHVVTALGILESDALFRGDRMVDRCQFLLDAIDVRTEPNKLWKMVAKAPVGFCNIRSGMLATLIEDIRGHMSLETIKRRFNEKMNPLQYQRPQAAPAAGNVKRAEELFQKLDLARSLERRLARLEELRPLWTPASSKRPDRPAVAAESGIFAAVPTKQSRIKIPIASMVSDGKTNITWSRFRDDVLPKASKIEVFLSNGSSLPWLVFTTAVHSDATPILAWDSEPDRNPLAWYCWSGGAPASQYGCYSQWNEVSAVSLLPNVWTAPADEKANRRVAFVVKDARETRQAGVALFPEFLRSELHEVRSVIESYSSTSRMLGLANGTACAISFQETGGRATPVTLRVTTDTLQSVYVIDRWN